MVRPAVERTHRTQVDLVLLDVMMPHLNGFEVCQKIKSNPETYLIPIVLVTALSDKKDRIEGIGLERMISSPPGGSSRTAGAGRITSKAQIPHRRTGAGRVSPFTLAQSN